jgi:hypothetical protein
MGLNRAVACRSEPKGAYLNEWSTILVQAKFDIKRNISKYRNWHCDGAPPQRKSDFHGFVTLAGDNS